MPGLCALFVAGPAVPAGRTPPAPRALRRTGLRNCRGITRKRPTLSAAPPSRKKALHFPEPIFSDGLTLLCPGQVSLAQSDSFVGGLYVRSVLHSLVGWLREVAFHGSLQPSLLVAGLAGEEMHRLQRTGRQ